MSESTHIQWTDATWNVITGCTRVSPGCEFCYAERQSATRLKSQPKYKGVAERVNGRHRWTGKIRLHEDALQIPLRWRKPRMIFVNSMSDTFHKDVKFEFIDMIFAVMALCTQHTFQVLTKRPERMAEYLLHHRDGDPIPSCVRRIRHLMLTRAEFEPWSAKAKELANRMLPEWCVEGDQDLEGLKGRWPLPKVWLGTSVENQEWANERREHLRAIPAAVRFVSYEPALGPVDWTGWEFLDWLILGGESGPGARPFHLEWARRTIRQCRQHGIAPYMKQFGALPIPSEEGDMKAIELLDSKGGNWDAFPDGTRVRDFPVMEQV